MGKQAIIAIGPSGSGKTFKRKELLKKNSYLQIVSRDEIWNLLNRNNQFNGLDFENVVTNIEENLVKNLIRKELSFYWDNCHLSLGSIEDCIKLIKESDSEYSIHLEIMDVSLAECKERNSKRINPVPETILENQFKVYKNNFNKYWDCLNYEGNLKKYIPDESKPEAVIFDLDGTLAHANERGWFEYKEVIFDSVDQIVARSLILYQERGFKIIILTARENKTFDGPILNCINVLELTELWLKENKIPYDYIFMREEFDSRKDSPVKLDLFDKHIRDNFNVQLVFEDRDKPVELFRSLGIKTYQVQEGKY